MIYDRTGSVIWILVGIENIDLVTACRADSSRIFAADENPAVGLRARPELRVQAEITLAAPAYQKASRVTIGFHVVIDNVPLGIAQWIEARKIVAGE